MARKIIYVEDDDTVRKQYARAIRQAGFEVDTYATARHALSALRRGLPDLALVDVRQAGSREAGYRLCTEIRHMSDVIPIILLTGRQSECDKIAGLRVGADDCIGGENSVEYILLRIEALLKRVDAIRRERESLSHGTAAANSALELDEENCTVRWRGKRIDMPLTQFWILRDLSHNPGKARSHRELMKAARLKVEANTIAANIKSIRRAFLKEDPSFHSIRTERNRGYRWLGE